MPVITVADLKAHLNLTTNDDDALLESKIAAAEEWVATWTGTGEWGDVVNPAAIPAVIREAVRQVASHLYEHREGDAPVPPAVYELISQHRNWCF